MVACVGDAADVGKGAAERVAGRADEAVAPQLPAAMHAIVQGEPVREGEEKTRCVKLIQLLTKRGNQAMTSYEEYKQQKAEQPQESTRPYRKYQAALLEAFRTLPAPAQQEVLLDMLEAMILMVQSPKERIYLALHTGEMLRERAQQTVMRSMGLTEDEAPQ